MRPSREPLRSWCFATALLLAGCAPSPRVDRPETPRETDGKTESVANERPIPGGEAGQPFAAGPAWRLKSSYDDGAGARVFVGFADAATKAEALAAARAQALKAAAEQVRVEVRSQFDHLVEETGFTRGGADSTAGLAWARARAHTRAGATLSGAEDLGDPWYEPLAKGGARCFTRVRVPLDELFPQRELIALASRKSPDPDAALTLAAGYQARSLPDLAEAAARLAARWNPTLADPHLLIADVAEQRGDLLTAVQALERAGDLLSPPERPAIARRAERVRALLQKPDDIVAGLLADCRARELPAKFAFHAAALPLGAQGRRADISFTNAVAGYLTCLWIDADGVAAWTPVEATRGDSHWSAGPHALRPVELNASGPVTVLAFLTPGPFEFPSLPVPPWPRGAAPEPDTVRRLYDLRAGVSDLLMDLEVRCAVAHFVAP